MCDNSWPKVTDEEWSYLEAWEGNLKRIERLKEEVAVLAARNKAIEAEMKKLVEVIHGMNGRCPAYNGVDYFAILY